jgi:hypothetical protein
VRSRRPLLTLLGCLAAHPAAAGDVPKAVAVLEVTGGALLPGHVADAAPLRFVLLEDGQVYVGGTSGIAVGKLTSGEQKALEKRLTEVRKVPGISSTVALGSGSRRQHLVVRKGRPLDIIVTGEPADAPGPLKPLAALLDDLSSFDHPSLRPFRPESYALRAREGKLPGGCRTWPYDEPLAGTDFTPRVVPAAQVVYWPTGAAPASVCQGDKSWIVTLRPLVPGETP